MLTFDKKGVCVSVRLDNINPNYMNPKPKMETGQIISKSKEILDDLMFTMPNFSSIDTLQNETWNWRKISSFCKQVDRKEVLLGYKEYPLLGVSLEGRGPFIRETKVGSEISAKSHQRVEKGDFIYSRLFAWKGSFGMITQETDGCYCSSEFPIFRCDGTVLEEFLLLYFLQPSTWRIVESYCTGTTKASRNRFKEHYFMNMEVPIPPLEIQEKLVSHHKHVKQIIKKSKSLKDTIDILSDAEIYNMFDEARNQKSTES